MRKSPLLFMLLIAGLATIVPGCGGEDESSSSGNPTDRAFVNGMVPHHEGAIEMAEIAKDRGEHREVRRLASDIVSAQHDEIQAMRAVDSELVKADVAVGDLGLSEKEMAMHGDVKVLREASPFDRAFIEMMVPHHRGAIRMATVENRNGKEQRLRKLAGSIIEAQQHEIKQMENWYSQWYGVALGTKGEDGAAHDAAGHGG